MEQWVKSINDEISKESYLDQARNIGRLVQEAKDSGYDDANDKYAQVILYGNNEALSPEANDNTRVIVSDFANFNFFKNAESYDPNTRTISLGDFKNMYNRGELSDETILEMSRQLDRRVGNTVTYDDNGVRIPLGERDNFNVNDIRYGLLPWLIGGIIAGYLYNNK